VPIINVTASIGSTQANALASCKAMYDAGVRQSGRYFINPSGANAYPVWCDMDTNGGGWTMVYNSVMSVDTLDFWYILYADRFGTRGSPDVATNFYNGDVYKFGRTYMDVIEDLRGKTVVGMVATTTGINTTNMSFASPAQVSGDTGIYGAQFAGGWAGPDADFDTYSAGNCSASYANVTQHYSSCWSYNLGADADSPVADGNAGPHVYTGVMSALGLSGDGSGSYSRVRRITRYAKW
jgi:hypothetical protein